VAANAVSALAAAGAGVHHGSTLIGVAQLGFTGQLVELDVTAALPG
jgi:hypothetical protein